MLIEEFLDLNHITVRPDPSVPHSVRACCYHDNDGNEFILYNPALSRDAALAALEHELDHIVNGEMYDPEYYEYEDLVSQEDIEFLKRLAHAYTMHARDMEKVYSSFRRPI